MRTLKEKFKLYNAQEDGVELIEFALVAPIFLVTVMGMLQVGWIFLNNNMLDYANRHAARHLSGDLQYWRSITNQGRYKQILCENAYIIDCSKLRLEVKKLEKYDGAPRPNYAATDEIYFSKIETKYFLDENEGGASTANTSGGSTQQSGTSGSSSSDSGSSEEYNDPPCFLFMARAYYPVKIFVPEFVMDFTNMHRYKDAPVSFAVSTFIERIR